MAHHEPGATRAKAPLGRRIAVVTTLAATLLLATSAMPAVSAVSANSLHTSATQTLSAAQSGQAQMKMVACPTTTRCLAIGSASSDQGVISYSTNAGATWSPVVVFDPTTILSLNSLTCPSAVECVAVGASLEHRGVAITGRFLKGAWRWSAPATMANETGRTNLPAVSLNSVACVSVTMCVAVGTDLTNGVNVTTFTTNAGQSWVPVSIAPGDGVLAGNFRAQLSAVSCATTTSCAAVGSDAAGFGEVTYGNFTGSTWTWSTAATQLPGDGQGGYLNALSCYSSTTCVAVGADTTSQGVSTIATRSGLTWTWSAETAITPDASGAGRLLALTCARTGACEAVGVDHNAQSIATRSLNGGVSWTPALIIANDGATSSTQGNDPAGIACATASRCVTVGTDSLARAFFTLSSTTGAQWNKESLYNVAALPGQGPLSYVSCSGALCVAVGSNDHNQSVVARSVNAGRTWGKETLIRSDASGASYVQGVSCVGGTLCVLVGWDNLSRPVVARSVNAGRTWSAEHTIGVDFSSLGFLNRVACPNVRRCVAVGWDGQGQAITSYSLNGGATWTRETTVTSDATGSGFLYSITCPTTTRCVAVGRDDQFKGVAAYSSNGGVGWSGLITLTSVTRGTGALDDVSCPAVNLCIGVGGTGTGAGASVVSRSTNGGRTWSKEVTVALDSTHFGLLTAVSCPSVTLCVAGGTDGFEQAVTTFSTDRGVTWSREATTASRAHKDFLTGVACSSTVLCVGVGADAAQRGVNVPIHFLARVAFAPRGGRGAMAPQVNWRAAHLRPVSFTRSGYRFLGWSTTPTGAVRYANRQIITFDANQTLYAVWARR